MLGNNLHTVATKKSPKKPNAEELVERVVSGFTSSWNYRESSFHTQWQNMYRLYNSERIYVSYNGISDTFVPMSFSTIETMVSATSGEKPLVEYIPTKFEQSTNTEVLNHLFSYFWDMDSWTNKFIQHSRNLFLYGTSVIYTYWDIDHPVARNIPIRDFFIDPSATILNYQNARYMGYRFLADKNELKSEQVVDPETGELVAKYKNLDKLNDNYEVGDQTDKQEKDTMMGSTLDKNAQKNQIEVLCYWTKDEVIYVGNRQQIIYQSDNYFKQRQQFLEYENPTGMYPFVVDANYPDESLLYGRSILQPIAKSQELLNDITNQNIDAVSWALDPVMELDPQYTDYMDKIQNVTGAVYPFKPGSLQAVQKPVIPSNAFNERVNIKNEIRETTAVDQVLKGVGSSGETTATEVKAQIASAGRRFDLILASLENGGYYNFAKLVFQMIQLYVTAPTMLRVVGEKGVDWQTFDPEMFKGDYEPRIKLQATLVQEKTKKMRDLKEMYSAMLGSPFINQHNMTRLIVRKAFDLEPDEVDGLVMSEEEMAKMAESQGGKDDNDPKELINYKDAPADIKAQMEEAAGYEPSPTHDGAIETEDMERGAQQAEAVRRVEDAFTKQVEEPASGRLV